LNFRGNETSSSSLRTRVCPLRDARVSRDNTLAWQRKREKARDTGELLAVPPLRSSRVNIRRVHLFFSPFPASCLSSAVKGERERERARERERERKQDLPLKVPLNFQAKKIHHEQSASVIESRIGGLIGAGDQRRARDRALFRGNESKPRESWSRASITRPTATTPGRNWSRDRGGRAGSAGRQQRKRTRQLLYVPPL